MLSERSIGKVSETRLILARAGATTDCIGCHDCRGLCEALIDLLSVPQSVSKPARR